MTVKNHKNGKFLVQIDRKGIPRTRKTFDDKKAAEIYERQYLEKHSAVIHNSDQRTLTELIDSWFIYHGINLADGQRRKRVLMQMAIQLGNPVASALTAEDFVNYRYKKTVTDDVRVVFKTFNNIHGYLNAMYSKLRKLKVIDYQPPTADIDFIKIQERQLTYLSHGQIDILLDSIVSGCENKSTWYVTQICLRTGARWGEAESLKRKHIHDGKIIFEFTKSKKLRTVPVDSYFFNELLSFSKRKNPDDRLFTNCINSFKKAVARTDLQFPRGQMTHILRHSFASHFMMNGENILTLQKILGHSDITVTMRYAHLSPEHLTAAIRSNPMSSTGGKVAVNPAQNRHEPPQS